MLTEGQYLKEKTLFNKSDCPPDSTQANPVVTDRAPLKTEGKTEYYLLHPERPINGSVNWENTFTIDNKPTKVECIDGRVITTDEGVKNLLVSQGWILTKTKKGEAL